MQTPTPNAAQLAAADAIRAAASLIGHCLARISPESQLDLARDVGAGGRVRFVAEFDLTNALGARVDAVSVDGVTVVLTEIPVEIVQPGA